MLYIITYISSSVEIFMQSCDKCDTWRVRVMDLNATFNNISVMSSRSVLLVEETRETHWHVASHRPTLSHKVVSSTPRLSELDIYFFHLTWYIDILYFRTRFHLILEIQYYSLFCLFYLHLPRPPGNIAFEIPARELYWPVMFSGLSQSIVNIGQG